MLILDRHKNEKIQIGKDVRLTVADIIGDRVKLGFEAPQTCRIMRGELLDCSEPPPKHCASYSDIVSFAEHCADEGWTTEQIIWLLQRPWRWEAEMKAFFEGATNDPNG